MQAVPAGWYRDVLVRGDGDGLLAGDEARAGAGNEQRGRSGAVVLGDLFDWLGFAPRLVDDAAQRHLELDACPFRDLARAYPHIVCTVHLGLLRGALSRLRVPAAEQAGLRPFVEPELCIADVPIPPQREHKRSPTPVR